VTSALILLSLSPPSPIKPEQMAAPVMLIICREITMSALREWAAAAGGGAHKVRAHWRQEAGPAAGRSRASTA
jgi:CDP-diacylglycerol--glycerol-3-phosphate 3-phosphatidyltransferase